MRKPVDIIFPPLKNGKISYFRLALRSISQLSFQANELTGLFFLAAVLIASPISCAYLTVAALLATVGRMLLGERGPILTTGLPGLNPCLIALSLPAFFQTGWSNVSMWFVLISCIAIAVVLVWLCVKVLPFPTLALPFLIIFWVLYALIPELDFLRPIALSADSKKNFHPVAAVMFSLGQAIFSPNIWSGMLFLIGLLLSNWRHALIAFLGAVISNIVSYYYRNADPMSVNLGLYGFNGVLAAVSVFVFCGGKFRLSLFGAVISTMLIPVIAKFGVQTLSSPFVFTTWLILGLGWVETNWFNIHPNDSPTTKSNDKLKTDLVSKDKLLEISGGKLMSSIVISNLIEHAKNLRTNGDWKPFHPGVTAHWLYNEPESNAEAVFLLYEAGARVPLHEHLGYEHMYVLDGDQSDENGSYPAGSFVIHPPGTKHSPYSVSGCVALLIYEKGVRFI